LARSVPAGIDPNVDDAVDLIAGLSRRESQLEPDSWCRCACFSGDRFILHNLCTTLKEHAKSRLGQVVLILVVAFLLVWSGKNNFDLVFNQYYALYRPLVGTPRK
jgi:hypothetical protein